MNILIFIAIIAVLYLLVYGITRILASIMVFIKIPWLLLIAGCITIVLYLRQYSIMNYAVIALTVILWGRLLIAQISVNVEKLGGDKKINKREYRLALNKVYACLYTFFFYGTLYANLNYILAVQIGGVPLEEFKEMGILTGKLLSLVGFGPIRWVVLLIAIVSLVMSYSKASDFDCDCGLINAEKKPISTVGTYFSDVLGISLQAKGDSVEANRAALQAYFQPLLQNDLAKAEKLTEAVLNAASFEITAAEDLFETLEEDSGLSGTEIVACIPKLKGS